MTATRHDDATCEHVALVSVVGRSPLLVAGVAALIGRDAHDLTVVHGTRWQSSADVVVLVSHDGAVDTTPVADPVPVVFVGPSPSSAAAMADAMAAGVRAFIDPTSEATALTAAVRAVAGGGHCLDRTHVDALAWALRDVRRSTNAPVRLTPREREILEAARSGQSTKQTARALGVSVKTVENTQRLLFSKLGVRTRAQAIARTHEMAESG